jgi:hypothetical protein
MAEIDDLIPDVKTNAPRAPDPLIERYLREGARRLCFVARLWRADASFTIAEDTDVITCPVSDAEIIGIRNARIDGRDLEAKTLQWLDENVCDWSDLDVDDNAARYLAQLTPNTLRLVPPATGTLDVRLILQPTKTAATLPDFLVALHSEAITKYAAAKVLMTPNETFQNPQLGAVLLADFERMLSTAKWQAAKGQQEARLRVKGRYL